MCKIKKFWIKVRIGLIKLAQPLYKNGQTLPHSTSWSWIVMDSWSTRKQQQKHVLKYVIIRLQRAKDGSSGLAFILLYIIRHWIVRAMEVSRQAEQAIYLYSMYWKPEPILSWKILTLTKRHLLHPNDDRGVSLTEKIDQSKH